MDLGPFLFLRSFGFATRFYQKPTANEQSRKSGRLGKESWPVGRRSALIRLELPKGVIVIGKKIDRETPYVAS